MKHSIFGLLTVAFLFLGINANGACILPDDAYFASQDGGCKDLATGRVWSNDPFFTTGGGFTQGGANNFCNNLVEGGYSDWRLATITELEVAGDHGAKNYLNLSGPGGRRWSKTAKKKQYWTYRFSDDSSVLLNANSPVSAICVR